VAGTAMRPGLTARISLMIYFERTAVAAAGKPDVFCRQTHLQAPVRAAAAIAMLRSGHVPNDNPAWNLGTDCQGRVPQLRVHRRYLSR
jgi:hypothetical protein